MTDATKLAAMTDRELRELRVTLARQPGAKAGELRLAVLDEEYRREMAKPVTAINAGRRPTPSLRFHTRSDPDLVARVIAAKRLKFDATEQVRPAE